MLIVSEQIWQHNVSQQQIRICLIDNKVVVAELLPIGGRLFTTTMAITAEYTFVRMYGEPAEKNSSPAKAACNSKG